MNRHDYGASYTGNKCPDPREEQLAVCSSQSNKPDSNKLPLQEKLEQQKSNMESLSKPKMPSPVHVKYYTENLLPIQLSENDAGPSPQKHTLIEEQTPSPVKVNYYPESLYQVNENEANSLFCMTRPPQNLPTLTTNENSFNPADDFGWPTVGDYRLNESSTEPHMDDPRMPDNSENLTDTAHQTEHHYDAQPFMVGPHLPDSDANMTNTALRLEHHYDAQLCMVGPHIPDNGANLTNMHFSIRHHYDAQAHMDGRHIPDHANMTNTVLRVEDRYHARSSSSTLDIMAPRQNFSSNVSNLSFNAERSMKSHFVKEFDHTQAFQNKNAPSSAENRINNPRPVVNKYADILPDRDMWSRKSKQYEPFVDQVKKSKLAFESSNVSVPSRIFYEKGPVTNIGAFDNTKSKELPCKDIGPQTTKQGKRAPFEDVHWEVEADIVSEGDEAAGEDSLQSLESVWSEESKKRRREMHMKNFIPEFDGCTADSFTHPKNLRSYRERMKQLIATDKGIGANILNENNNESIEQETDAPHKKKRKRRGRQNFSHWADV